MIAKALWYVFSFIVFPGFLFSTALGLLFCWVDRKVTARVQFRVGPPLAQPLYDVLKLLGKETILPAQGNPFLFILAPLVGFASAVMASTIIWLANLYSSSFVGDLIVVVYLLAIPPLAVMIGGFASANPLAVTGASREMKLLLAYELPLLISLAVVILKGGMSIRLADLVQTHPMASISGVLCFVVSLLCIQAKLGYPPFDIAEAETELMEGPYLEYSGPPLALFKLTQAIMLLTLPVYLISVFLGGLHLRGLGILWAVLKYVGILVLIVLIKNTNPRLRIDQALRLFWRYLTPATVVAFILAAVGRAYGVVWL